MQTLKYSSGLESDNEVKNQKKVCSPSLKDRVQCHTNIGLLRIVHQLPEVDYDRESILK